MRYRIASGIVIKSENAAKPASQSSSHLRTILANLEPVSSSFDCGCGKLRYLRSISPTTDRLVLVDSEAQLSREQMICGERNSIRGFVAGSNNLVAQNTSEFAAHDERFDRGFCINVLSVIPIIAARKRLLSLIHQKLRPGAKCLFVVQYRNSDFTRMAKMPNAHAWRDGFLIDSMRGYSFYGLIRPEDLARSVTNAGFAVLDKSLNEGSVYLWAQAPDQEPDERFNGFDETANFRALS